MGKKKEAKTKTQEHQYIYIYIYNFFFHFSNSIFIVRKIGSIPFIVNSFLGHNEYWNFYWVMSTILLGHFTFSLYPTIHREIFNFFFFIRKRKNFSTYKTSIKAFNFNPTLLKEEKEKKKVIFSKLHTPFSSSHEFNPHY